jgi:hypothetical protein
MRCWPIVLALAFVVFVGWWLHQPGGAPDGGEVGAVTARPGLPWSELLEGPDAATAAGGPASGPGAAGSSPLANVAPPVFRLTPQGRLQVDEQTRADIERVAALHGRDEALARLDEASRSLGEAARREARALYEQLVQYEQALATALSSEPEHPGIADARRQLQLMQALRAQHFGERAADLFGAEEALQQRLLDDAEEAMRTRGLSLEEAIGQAQARLARDGAGAATPP